MRLGGRHALGPESEGSEARQQVVSIGNHPGEEEVWSGREQGTEGWCPALAGTQRKGGIIWDSGVLSVHICKGGWSRIFQDEDAKTRRWLGLGVEGVTGAGYT